jgi:hypothetical protein
MTSQRKPDACRTLAAEPGCASSGCRSSTPGLTAPPTTEDVLADLLGGLIHEYEAA